MLALISSGLACVFDVRKGTIPNWLSYTSLTLAFLFTFLDGSRSFADTILGFLIGFVLPFVLFFIGRLGGGDVKILGALGATLGYPQAIDLLLWTCVFGFLVALVIVVAAGRLRELGMDILEMILVTFQQKLGLTAAPVRGLSTPLAVAMFISVCWLVFFPDHSQLFVHFRLW